MFKIHERNMQELWDTILRKTNLWFIDIDEDQWYKLGRQQDHRRNSPKIKKCHMYNRYKKHIELQTGPEKLPMVCYDKNIRYTEQ